MQSFGNCRKQTLQTTARLIEKGGGREGEGERSRETEREKERGRASELASEREREGDR